MTTNNNNTPILEIKNLKAAINTNQILKNLNLSNLNFISLILLYFLLFESYNIKISSLIWQIKKMNLISIRV